MSKNAGNQANDTKQLKFQGPVFSVPVDGADQSVRVKLLAAITGTLEENGVDLTLVKYVQWQLKTAPAKMAGNDQTVAGTLETYFDLAVNADDIWEASNFLESRWQQSSGAAGVLVFQFLSK